MISRQNLRMVKVTPTSQQRHFGWRQFLWRFPSILNWGLINIFCCIFS